MKNTINFLGRLYKKKAALPQIVVTAFGKHKVCDDHIDMVGYGSDLINKVRKLLYNEGIRSNIECGLWKGLERDNQIDFDHYFYWKSAGLIVAGKLWASSDGKGRSDYPMVLCAEFPYKNFTDVQPCIEHLLNTVQDKLVNSTSLNELQEVIDESSRSINHTLREQFSNNRSVLTLNDIKKGFTSEELSLMIKRVMYHLFNGADFNIDQINKIAGHDGCYTLRVPSKLLTKLKQISNGDGVYFDNIEPYLWFDFVDLFFEGYYDVIVIYQKSQGYLDVIIGHAPISEFYCLKAARGAMPLTTDIPYNINDFEKQFKVE